MKRTLMFCTCACLSLGAHAYDPVNHGQMSIESADRSILKEDPLSFSRLGLFGHSLTASIKNLPSSQSKTSSIAELIRFGSSFYGRCVAC